MVQTPPPFCCCHQLILEQGEPQRHSCFTSALHSKERLCREPGSAWDNGISVQIPPFSAFSQPVGDTRERWQETVAAAQFLTQLLPTVSSWSGARVALTPAHSRSAGDSSSGVGGGWGAGPPLFMPASCLAPWCPHQPRGSSHDSSPPPIL